MLGTQAALALGLPPVALLAEDLAGPVEHAVERAGLPKALVGVVIARQALRDTL